MALPISDTSAPAPTIAYISGVSRCGSTLLSFLLNSHPEIVTVGEMHAPIYPLARPDDRMCSCGSRAKDCEFLLEVTRRLAQENLEFDPRTWDMRYSVRDRPQLSRLFFGSLRSSLLEDVRDGVMGLLPAYRSARRDLDWRNERFMQSARDIAGARVFVDATKDPIRIRFLNRLAGPRLRVIHLVRDPRGFANSMLRDRKTPPGEGARTWRRINENIERHLQRIPPDNWRRLNYESICADPEGTLRDLSVFLGVQPSEQGASFKSGENHITGNKMAFDFSGQIKLDEKWRHVLSARDLEGVAGQAGAMARRYGYDL